MRNIKFNSLTDIWPIFSIHVKHSVFKENSIRKSTSSKIKLILSSCFSNLKQFFKLGKYNTWILSSSIDLFEINGKLFDNVTSSYIDLIENSILIVRPHTLIDHQKIWTQNYIFESFIIIISIFLKSVFKILRLSIPFENELKKKADNINYKEIYYRFLSEYYVFSFLVKIFGIERVYVNCSYSYFGYIYACRVQGVEVIEIQHGLIPKGHLAYKQDNISNFNFFPNKINVYGDFFKDILNEDSSIFRSEDIQTIGSNALEIYSQISFKKDSQLFKLKKLYKKVVLFCGQYPVDMKSLPILDEIQLESNDICFLFLTRYKEELIKYKSKFKNVIFYEGSQKFYELIQQVDMHGTVYSTTFLESLYFGKPNIILDIDNYPSKYYNKIIEKNYSFIKCSKEKEEVLNFVMKDFNVPKDKIKESVNEYFNTSFLKNLKNSLNETT